MIEALKQIEVLTLFVADLEKARRFYRDVFGLPVVFEDDVSSVMQIGPIMINLLLSSEASDLVTPKTVASPDTGPRALLTIKVADVDAVCRDLQALKVSLLNGPIDQPWGRRTAAFEDPDGNVWEVAQEI